MANEKLINEAKAVWATLCEPNWQKENLIALGKLLFARVPWDKLEPETKILFIRAALAADKAGAPAPTKSSEDITKETPTAPAPAPTAEPNGEDKKGKKKDKKVENEREAAS